MSSRARAEVAVVGAGIVGLSTAYALAERGLSVRVYDHGEPGHAQSGGEGRIFRHAHDDPRLVAFARDSRAVWAEWEARLGLELVSADGALAIGGAVERRIAVLDRVGGIPARRVGPAEIAERLAPLAAYDGPAMLDEAGGSIRTGAAIGALAGALRDSLVREEVVSLRETAAGTVEVRAGAVRAEHARVIVCAGDGTTRLARGAGLSLPVAHAVHVRVTFALRGPAPATLACLQDSSGAWGEAGIYASASPGNRRYAVGVGEAVDAREDGSLVDPAGLAGLAERAIDYAGRALPGLDPTPVEYRHCRVTTLPWGGDGVAVWQAGPILFAAGHNLFKQAPGLGRALAAAAAGDGLPEALRPEARLGAPPG